LIGDLDLIKRMGKDKPMVTIGKEYVVYGVHSDLGCIWYFISDDSESPYPVSDLAVYFDTKDPAVSRTWEFHYEADGGFALWPSSWFRDQHYIERVVEGEREYVADFKRIKEEIDKESNA
jgi:hypothetical protein